jgi:catechol 2,3-dioxygenase-like lactoylglutathione lyase family enzyme
MRLLGLDHMNIRCRPQDLPAMEAFYAAALGLKPGPRPAFAFPGAWLYLGDQPVVHISARYEERMTAPGPYDHVSFKAEGLDETRERLKTLGVPFGEGPVPGFPLHQIFFTDPAGAKVELTFETPATN